jgi:hypothetical protein
MKVRPKGTVAPRRHYSAVGPDSKGEFMADGTSLDIYEAVIADLEGKIAALQATIDSLRSVQGISGQIASGTVVQQRAKQVEEFGHDAFFGMTVADATRKYLSSIRKTASINTITSVLVAGGLKSASKNIPENIRTILSRHADFLRINGEFGLAEWYPGRKVQRRSFVAGTVTHLDDEGNVISQVGSSSEPEQPS